MKISLLFTFIIFIFQFFLYRSFGHENAPLGGHKDEIIMTSDYVYKLKNQIEYDFYTILNQVELEYRDIFPQGGLVVEKEGKSYLAIENLVSSFKTPFIMDVKIGQSTTSKQMLSKKKQGYLRKKNKQLRHWLTDRINGARNRGFFLVKAYAHDSYNEDNVQETLKYYHHPLSSVMIIKKIFDYGHNREIKHCYEQKLNRILEFLENNLPNKAPHQYKFIGNSLLFVHDINENTCDIKMIDFANSLIRSEISLKNVLRNRKKHLRGQILGVKNLRRLLLTEK